MDSITKYTKGIADYLYNEMTLEEEQAFEEKIKSDEELSREFNRQSRIMNDLKDRLVYEDVMNDPHLEEAERLAKSIASEMSVGKDALSEVEEKHLKASRRRIYYAAAASIIVLLSIGGSLLLNPSQDKLYQQYYEPFSSSSFSERGNNSVASISDRGIEAYMSEDYVGAIEAFSQVDENGVYPAEVSFFLGLAYMANEDFANAQLIFEQHLNSSSQFVPEVEWYLGLCNIQEGDVSEARTYLNKCSEFDGKFGKDAKKLLRKLGRANE